jgi:hypothetical protein
MLRMNSVVAQLKVARDRCAQELQKLDAAIGVLSGKGGKRSRRRMSAAGRKKIAAAQRARWAKWKASKKR